MTGRRFRRPHVVLPVLLWAAVLAMVPQGGEAAPLPPAAKGSAEPADLEARQVVAHLVALGVSPEDARARLDDLSDAERRALAQRLDEIGAGGSVAAVFAIAIIVGLVAVLVLELIGRRVLSRPSEQ
jgi:uncharacterized protein DUF6627